MQGGGNDRNIWLSRHVLPHEPALRRFLSLQHHPPGIDADDVVQEVYGRLAEMESIAAVRDPRSYIIGMARNILLMHLRRSRIVSISSASDLEIGDIGADEPTPEDCASDRQQLHKLALAVARIKEPWRSAFLLRVIDELPHREIGERLGMSENAVQKSHAKTLVMLMNLLGRGGNRRSRATDGRDANGSEPQSRAEIEHGD